MEEQGGETERGRRRSCQSVACKMISNTSLGDFNRLHGLPTPALQRDVTSECVITSRKTASGQSLSECPSLYISRQLTRRDGLELLLKWNFTLVNVQFWPRQSPKRGLVNPSESTLLPLDQTTDNSSMWTQVVFAGRQNDMFVNLTTWRCESLYVVDIIHAGMKGVLIDVKPMLNRLTKGWIKKKKQPTWLN